MFVYGDRMLETCNVCASITFTWFSFACHPFPVLLAIPLSLNLFVHVECTCVWMCLCVRSFFFVALNKSKRMQRVHSTYLFNFVAPMSRIFTRTEKCLYMFLYFMCVCIAHTHTLWFVYTFFSSLSYSSFHGISFRFVFFLKNKQNTIYV